MFIRISLSPRTPSSINMKGIQEFGQSVGSTSVKRKYSSTHKSMVDATNKER
jgi:hypothetical protein